MPVEKRKPVLIAIIGGSGVYEIEGMEVEEEVDIDTPFGKPSDTITIGRVGGRQVAFLPRHGKNHQFNPTSIPQLANIWALKKVGVFWVVGVSATGSLKEGIKPRDFVIPDQVIDRTRHRKYTFFSDIAVHASFADPFDPIMRKLILDACRYEDITTHDGGTYVCMEGPMFSTRAESNMHRSWGASLIGMTALPEAKLAREAEMCYASMSLVTDYDVWKYGEYVSVEAVIKAMEGNVVNAKKVLGRVIKTIPLGAENECEASRALKNSIQTKPVAITPKIRDKVGLFINKYL